MAFFYRERELYCENIPVREIAEKVGTPFYLYSYNKLKDGIRSYTSALKKIEGITCYAVKANSNLAVLRAIFKEGAGADIVSGGELFRALRAGVDPQKTVFAGVGKTKEEMAYALRANILMFNVESEEELELLNEVAKQEGKKALIAIRVNPDVDPQTHPYISTGLKESKFGIDIEESIKIYEKARNMENIKILGIHCHIGSQITSLSPFIDAAQRIFTLIDRLKDKGIELKFMDIGGGIGITYKDENPPSPEELVDSIKDECIKRNIKLIMEPGRSIVGNAGIFVTKILYVKRKAEKIFYVVDGAMNDLARPSLYKAYHEIKPVKECETDKIIADVVGPICETGDFFAQRRELPFLKSGELLAIMSAGAYGFTMASNYNSRPRVPEIMVNNDKWFIVRDRESYEDLVRGERIPEFLME